MKNFTLIIVILFTSFSYGQLTLEHSYSTNGDGDSIVVIDSLNNQITLRLAEVDCPESGQPFGKNAKMFTAEQVGMKDITYEAISKDQYGRIIAKVFYGGKYLSEEIIKNGFGWHYKRYSTSKKLSTLELLAKKDSLGLWQDKKAIAPWEYRKLN